MDIALVTGAAQGMGLKIAQELANQGDRVCLVDIQESVLYQADLLKSQGLKAQGFQCDVSNVQSVNEVVGKIIEKYGSIDKLVNAAGISASVSFIDPESDEVLDKIMKVNFLGTWNFCREVIPYMLENSRGSIVNFASVTGPVASDPGMSAYAASKGAVYGLTKSLAIEFADRGINVNSVMPGYVWTNMVAKYNPENPEIVREKFSKGIPMGRMAEVGDVASVVVFLLSEGASYITGQGIVIDGGSSIVETKEIIKKGGKKLE